jgi:hypothetical protein
MRHESELQKQRKHWEELASQLGLEPEPDMKKESPKDDLPPKLVPQEINAARTIPAKELSSSPEHASSESRREQSAQPFLPPLSQEKVQQEVFRETEMETQEPSGPPKRGRGRRSDKKSNPPDLEHRVIGSSELSFGEQQEAREDLEKSDNRGGRGRRRGRRKKISQPEPDEGGSFGDAARSSSAAEDDTEETDNLSDWSVPSWTDLIASLYRPDR